jgi:hypothetical protein
MKHIPIAAQNGKSFALHGCVRASAQFSARGMFTIVSSPAATFSCSHSCFTWRCLTLPTPWRRITPLAADASVRNSSGSSSPREAANLWTFSPSTAPLRAAFSSASHEDNAMLDCNLHHQLMVCWPLHTTPHWCFSWWSDHRPSPSR